MALSILPIQPGGREGDDVNNRQLVERYRRAHLEQDWASVAEMTAPDVVVSYPQSGETFRGSSNYTEHVANYPGRLDDSELTVTRLHLPKESVHVIASPIALPTITVTGAGDDFFFEGVVKYPDGGVFNIVGLIELGVAGSSRRPGTSLPRSTLRRGGQDTSKAEYRAETAAMVTPAAPDAAGPRLLCRYKAPPFEGRWLATADFPEDRPDVGSGDTPREAVRSVLRALGEPYATEMAQGVESVDPDQP